MYTINSARKKFAQFSVYSVDGKKVLLKPHLRVDIASRVTLTHDQIGHHVMSTKAEEVLKLHCKTYLWRYEDPVIQESLLKKWERKHFNCSVCVSKREAFKSLRSVPDDLGLDRLFGDTWRHTLDVLSPHRSKVVDSIFYMNLMDLRHMDLEDPPAVETVITQLQDALYEAVHAIQGESNLWTYHRRVLNDFLEKHDKEMATMAVWMDKSAYYHKKSMQLLSQIQDLRVKFSLLQIRFEKASLRYNLKDPDASFILCKRPFDCDGYGDCCGIERDLPKEEGCVICTYPACLQCMDIRHRY